MTSGMRARLTEARRATEDLVPLVQFRLAARRGRARRSIHAGLLTLVAVTVAAAWLPAYLPDGSRLEVASLLPSGMVGILVVAIVSAASSGGGRELLARDRAVAFPVSPTTDHLGALMLAPLNIAWLLQAWALLGATAYVSGPVPGLGLVQLMMVTWLACATALAQVVGWGTEWVRRGGRGRLLTRAAAVGFGSLLGFLVSDNLLVPVLEASPTLQVAAAALSAHDGPTWQYAGMLAGLLVATAGSVVAGALLAATVSRRVPREEMRLETATFPGRATPASDLLMLLRLDRAAIWRSVPLRRGLLVLAVMPGLVAVAGAMRWDMVTILPGLVASGGALLFGVNAWCLDGRGALWRESLPVEPGVVFVARALVLAEVLTVASIGTLALAAVRAGAPTSSEAAAVAGAGVVVIAQVVSASLRWSVRQPFAAELRSARATPAPPMVMVAYSARLALSTTLVGLVFSALATVSWEWSVLVAVTMLLFSLWRLARTAGRWSTPEVRSQVVAVVAG